MRTTKRDIVGGFIISKDGLVLLGKNRSGGVFEGSYVVPGGGVDEGETKLEALAREMLEETGIDVSSATITQVNTASAVAEKTLRDSGERVLVDMNFYDYQIDLPTSAEATTVTAIDDWLEPKWFKPEDLKQENISKTTYATLQKMGIV